MDDVAFLALMGWGFGGGRGELITKVRLSDGTLIPYSEELKADVLAAARKLAKDEAADED